MLVAAVTRVSRRARWRATDVLSSAQWGEIKALVAGRSKKQCRERWGNTLNPGINPEPWATPELVTIMELQHLHGTKWQTIAQTMRGRTALQCRNAYNALTASLSMRAPSLLPAIADGTALATPEFGALVNAIRVEEMGNAPRQTGVATGGGGGGGSGGGAAAPSAAGARAAPAPPASAATAVPPSRKAAGGGAPASKRQHRGAPQQYDSHAAAAPSAAASSIGAPAPASSSVPAPAPSAQHGGAPTAPTPNAFSPLYAPTGSYMYQPVRMPDGTVQYVLVPVMTACGPSAGSSRASTSSGAQGGPDGGREGYAHAHSAPADREAGSMPPSPAILASADMQHGGGSGAMPAGYPPTAHILVPHVGSPLGQLTHPGTPAPPFPAYYGGMGGYGGMLPPYPGAIQMPWMPAAPARTLSDAPHAWAPAGGGSGMPAVEAASSHAASRTPPSASVHVVQAAAMAAQPPSSLHSTPGGAHEADSAPASAPPPAPQAPAPAPTAAVVVHAHPAPLARPMPVSALQAAALPPPVPPMALPCFSPAIMSSRPLPTPGYAPDGWVYDSYGGSLAGGLVVSNSVAPQLGVVSGSGSGNGGGGSSGGSSDGGGSAAAAAAAAAASSGGVYPTLVHSTISPYVASVHGVHDPHMPRVVSDSVPPHNMLAYAGMPGMPGVTVGLASAVPTPMLDARLRPQSQSYLDTVLPVVGYRDALSPLYPPSSVVYMMPPPQVAYSLHPPTAPPAPPVVVPAAGGYEQQGARPPT